ncbi:UPF0690 protein C1orf52-like protein [Trichoplax sp. H2]|uniref:Uncharacterized protein n=1 Tax=Trichoplax adhaerens TaxID=10228 RepID=B3RNX7_TRIAD|nr:hypothetical protein TRIADDRAFT_53329 [Trichoplax adhaerens]EDV28093.1 hypothetical protein TRIADDRAFT_53329 [Trichoplax adhaerens]RDD43488.1 UPF0690 protein C1orf52-like protein [Trichoplax sp. H2]|eukprot:XP_002109927.1 hypothetical protein TRIADDRAFT_53329 [Trichoplax adhaerens]
MSASNPASDPLSFLANDDTSSSDSDDENIKSQPGQSTVTTTTEDNASINKTAKGIVLPDPEAILSKKTRPSFYRNDDDDYYNIINWEIVSDQVFSSAKAMHKKVPTISGPMSSNPNVVSAAPVKYSETNDPSSNAETTENDLDKESSKMMENQPTTSNIAHDKFPTKRKTSDAAITYRQREKRKRDLGQSARGKSYVEEEKRILKQSFNNDRF